MIQCNEWVFSLSQKSTKFIFRDTVKFSGDTLVFRDTQFGKHWIKQYFISTKYILIFVFDKFIVEFREIGGWV